ncbi:hypothetical protein PHJA_002601700 [Phtheirospermum japonicum]|uniref:KIB1-4 beta-propeller domain-containing protein n=1 Tax=Phtheirospermum japonicum TaxID=374723 RepID=A0A830CVI8_9LAMI|nr:hypothetical protein PHJA_002601700 [Phtheirospermum japonicum]
MIRISKVDDDKHLDFSETEEEEEEGLLPYLCVPVEHLVVADDDDLLVVTHHAVALPATQFPGLKPNSIYFTNAIETGSWRGEDDDTPFGGHDIGIFNYQDRTVSSCYYPCDVQSLKKILPVPMWFFPSSPI